MVVAKQGSAVSFVPVDGTAYTAISDFTSAVDLGSGNKVVYIGGGNTVALTGLSQGTTYHFQIYEFNGSGTTINYLTISPLAGNQATLSNTSSITAGPATRC